MQAIFVGTGTSGNVPYISCLIEEPVTCKVCKSALITSAPPTELSLPLISKNRRRNTSCLVRIPHPDGRMRNILIDCGKTFYESALTWFTQYRIRNLDGVILTHGHADAMLGLDDLRQWTMAPGNKPGLQATVNIYLDEATMKVVSGAFPYMVDTAKATGSGEVASLQFHLISQTEPFEIDGIKIQPFKVEHGKVKGGEPYYALGFRINDFSYVSDTNKIPPEGIEIIKGSNTIIMDALRPTEHSSHFSFKQAFDTLESLLPDSGKGYFVGLTHDVEHEDILQWIKDQKGTKNITCAYDGLMIDME